MTGQTKLFSFLPDYRHRVIVILVSCLLLNLNTLRNTYALDDEMVISKNIYMHMGFAGIKTILQNDAYQGFLDEIGAKNPLSGGRYRPLSIISFAIEEQLFSEPLGKEYLEAKNKFTALQNTSAGSADLQSAARDVINLETQIKENTLKLAPIRHAFQVIYFTLSMLILFWFLSKFLIPKYGDVAFCTTLLFVFHPIHTEVIANLKSRDEIFSLLFILLSFIHAIKYLDTKTFKHLGLMLLFTLCALLSKEYAVVLPLVTLGTITLVRKSHISDNIKSKWFVAQSAMVILFMMIRQQITGHKSHSMITDVLNDPFMYATWQQKLATKIALLNQYLKLLIIPHPLSADYSYNNFPYYSFGSWQVWFSILVWGSIVYFTYRLWQKKHILTWACIFFISFFMLINNLLFDIGATLGERLIYHSSLSFCLVLAWLYIYSFEKLKLPENLKKGLFLIPFGIILSVFGYKTMARNIDWANNLSLFSRDVKYVPNSALANGNAGSEYYNRAYLKLKNNLNPTHYDTFNFNKSIDTAIIYLTKAITIHPRYVSSLINRGLCYSKKGDLRKAIRDWKQAALNFNGRNANLIEHARTLLVIGKDLGVKKDFKKATLILKDASILDPENAEIWNNLGGCEFTLGHFTESGFAFNKALGLNPNLQDAIQGFRVANNFIALKSECQKDSLNPVVWQNASTIYRNSHFEDLANKALERANKLKQKDMKLK